jgi:hypothetical protein
MDVHTDLPDVMELLASHVPITLLADLADDGPVSSRSILQAEPADIAWITPHQPQASGE